MLDLFELQCLINYFSELDHFLSKIIEVQTSDLSVRILKWREKATLLTG